MTRPSRTARPPLLLGLPALLAVAFLLVPLLGVVTDTPWSTLRARLGDPAVTEALRLSWLLARAEFRGKALVRCLVLLPMVLPPTVAGVALLRGFGRRGLLGGPLDALGIGLPFTTGGAVAAAVFVAMPFLVLSLEGALTGLDPQYEEAAATMGAGALTTLRLVTLPLVRPSLAAGAALCWARALGEFGATITFAGNLPGATQTLPLKVYLLLQEDPAGATAVSLLLLAVAAAVLLALRGRWLPAGRRS